MSFHNFKCPSCEGKNPAGQNTTTEDCCWTPAFAGMTQQKINTIRA